MLLELTSILDSDHTLFFGSESVTPHWHWEDNTPINWEDGNIIELDET